jgi:hypothetical protein
LAAARRGGGNIRLAVTCSRKRVTRAGEPAPLEEKVVDKGPEIIIADDSATSRLFNSQLNEFRVQ